MGKINSASTVYATAYLTEKGRTYLFNKNNVRFDSNGNDLFEIKTFTLGDPDTNYRTEQLLASGDIPDATGKSEGILKSVADYSQTIFAYFAIDLLSAPDPLYMTDSPENSLIISTDTAFPVNSDTPPAIKPPAGIPAPTTVVPIGGFTKTLAGSPTIATSATVTSLGVAGSAAVK